MSTAQRIPISDVVSIAVGIGKASASNVNIYYFPVQATDTAGRTSEILASGIGELKNDVADPTKTTWTNTYVVMNANTQVADFDKTFGARMRAAVKAGARDGTICPDNAKAGVALANSAKHLKVCKVPDFSTNPDVLVVAVPIVNHHIGIPTERIVMEDGKITSIKMTEGEYLANAKAGSKVMTDFKIQVQVNLKAIADGQNGVKVLLRSTKVSLAASVNNPTADLILTAADRVALGTANLDPNVKLHSAKPKSAPKDDIFDDSDESDDENSDDSLVLHALDVDSSDEDEDVEDERVTPKAKTPKARGKKQDKAKGPTKPPAKSRKPPAVTSPTPKPKGKAKQVQHDIDDSDEETETRSLTAKKSKKWSKAESDKRYKLIDAKIAYASKRADEMVSDGKRKRTNAQPATPKKGKKNPVTPPTPAKSTAIPVRMSARGRMPKRT